MKLIEFGIEYAIEQCRDLIKAGVQGLHFYTMDRSKSTYGIISG
ncbi:methylenetetrahydrofolate reductase, partial [Bacteroidota bacterium]